MAIERVQYRGRWRTVEVLACPVTWSPHPQQIEGARQAYVDWWQALDWVREALAEGGMLRDLELTEVMPRGGRGGDAAAALITAVDQGYD